jgi:hypothetical protein
LSTVKVKVKVKVKVLLKVLLLLKVKKKNKKKKKKRKPFPQKNSKGGKGGTRAKIKRPSPLKPHTTTPPSPILNTNLIPVRC